MPDILTIQDCMAKVMGDVREVAKNDVNQAQHFTFRGVDAVVNAVAPALRRYGVIVTPARTEVSYQPFVTGKGSQMMCARVLVTYRFTGPGADFMEAQVAGEAFDSGDKATAKAMSVAFRTALLQALALPTDDLDPDAETYDVGESTVEPHAGQGSVTSPRDGEDAQASGDALSGKQLTTPDVSPALSVVPGGTPDSAAPGDGSLAYGEGAASSTPPGAAPQYLSSAEQRELIQDYGSNKKVVEAFQARFGERIKRIADITCEMVEAMNE
jgi:ERF superfamily protein